MGKKKRVLHVLDILTSNSGTSNVVMNYVRQSCDSNYIIDVVVYKKSQQTLIKEIEALGGQVFKLSEIKANSYLKFRKEFANVIKDNDYKIIHGHLANSVFLYMSEAKKAGVPIRIIHSHSTTSSSNIFKRLRNGILNYFIPGNCNYYVACSSTAAQNLFSKFINLEDVTVLPNCIDSNKFRYNQEVRNVLKEQYNVKDNFIIGHVGRFEKEKNHCFLINTFYTYKNFSSNSKLILIGDGSLTNEIKAMIEDKGLTNDVLILGVIDNVNQFYQLFDCFWLPSLFEGFGIAALEAQCSGLPCIVSENVPKDVMLAECISSVELNNTGKWIELTKQAECDIDNRRDNSAFLKSLGYDVAEQGKRLFKLYDKLLVKGNI